MTKSKMVFCSSCLQWFCYNPETKNGIEVKRRGYYSRYYCAECIANSKISNKESKEYGHIKSKETD